MSDPKVSIVTPTYNPGTRLERCIASVGAQTYENVEHIVVDAESTDGTVELLMAKPNIRWVSEPDQGQADALNKGFRMAEGELLTWINGDDTLEPDAVRYVVEAYERTGAEWIYGNCEMWDERSAHLWDPPHTLSQESFYWGCPIAQQGTFFSKRAFESIGGIDASFDLSMDFDLWLRLLEAGIASTYVDKVLGRFEVHELSKTGSRGYDEFLVEGALALRRRGSTGPSDLMVGRAAAFRIGRANGSKIAAEMMKKELRRILEAHTEFGDVDVGRALAGGYAEAADVELRKRRPFGHLAGLRHLARPAPWRYRLTRSSALGNLRVAAARTLERARRF
ncbi:MAG TPA: glycosyltransferase family 2 protein [Actinomycetota bacterium]|nr:glycosyltransferase family 2 protein [Actinomycetota bacterium]